MLPLAMLWFGLGTGILIFVLVHSVLWSVALNTHAGFMGVSSTLRMVGKANTVAALFFLFSCDHIRP